MSCTECWMINGEHSKRCIFYEAQPLAVALPSEKAWQEYRASRWIGIATHYRALPCSEEIFKAGYAAALGAKKP